MKEIGKGLWKIIKGLGGLLICIFVFMALFGAFDDEAEEIGNAEIFRGNDTKSVFSDDTQVRVTEDGEIVGENKPDKEAAPAAEASENDADSSSIDAVTINNKDYDKYLHNGEKYTSEDGTITMEVINVDTKIFEVGDLITTQVYVVLDITNDDPANAFYLDQSNAALFIDDYEVSRGANTELFAQNGYYLGNGNVSYPTSINIQPGGRKGMIVFMADIDNKTVNEDSKIDFEICGMVFKINPLFILNASDQPKTVSVMTESDEEMPDTSSELDGMTPIEAHEGVYVCSDNDAVLTIYETEDGFKVDAQNTGGYDFEGKYLMINPDAREQPSYIIFSDGGEATLDFYGDSGLSAGGYGIGGWYDRVE